MRESPARTLVLLFAGLLLVAFILLRRPDYLAKPEMLGTVIAAQIVIAAISRYKQLYFLMVMAAFLWAGLVVPMSEAWLQGRWVVLGIGVVVGVASYMRDRHQRHLGTIHLLALFCVLSATVSASVSGYPEEALLKSLSLFLLFAYAAMGARLTVSPFEPEKFFRKLLLACEIAMYIAAFMYFVVREPIFGNPNSLGAVMGVIVVPVLFWGFLSAESTITRRRVGLEVCLAGTLLMSSFSRAGIAAAAVSCFAIAVAVRQYRLIVSGVVVTLVIATLTVMFVPRPLETLQDDQSESVASLFLYKGKPGEGLLGSRIRPWDETMTVIKKHPWFGSGFGTSVSGQSAIDFEFTRSRFIESRMVREHGNSYLAIMEWSGLLGVFPFYLLVLVTAWQAKRALSQLRRSGNIGSPAVPAAAVIIAGVIGAGFEDWLFAVGYYVSVFFWVMAFILTDLLPSPMSSVQENELAASEAPFAVPVGAQ